MRVAAGSGLRPDVWKEFSRRFGKIQIREGYGLTEASVGFLNYTAEIGPIGRAGYFNKVNDVFQTLRLTKFVWKISLSKDHGQCQSKFED